MLDLSICGFLNVFSSCYDALFGTWDIVLGPLLLHALGLFFARRLLATNLYASGKTLCPIFVLDWLNTGPLGLILA